MTYFGRARDLTPHFCALREKVLASQEREICRVRSLYEAKRIALEADGSSLVEAKESGEGGGVGAGRGGGGGSGHVVRSYLSWMGSSWNVLGSRSSVVSPKGDCELCGQSGDTDGDHLHSFPSPLKDSMDIRVCKRCFAALHAMAVRDRRGKGEKASASGVFEEKRLEYYAICEKTMTVIADSIDELSQIVLKGRNGKTDAKLLFTRREKLCSSLASMFDNMRLAGQQLQSSLEAEGLVKTGKGGPRLRMWQNVLRRHTIFLRKEYPRFRTLQREAAALAAAAERDRHRRRDTGMKANGHGDDGSEESISSPEIVSIEPVVCSVGGGIISLTGTGFTPRTVVLIGGDVCSSRLQPPSSVVSSASCSASYTSATMVDRATTSTARGRAVKGEDDYDTGIVRHHKEASLATLVVEVPPQAGGTQEGFRRVECVNGDGGCAALDNVLIVTAAFDNSVSSDTSLDHGSPPANPDHSLPPAPTLNEHSANEHAEEMPTVYEEDGDWGGILLKSSSLQPDAKHRPDSGWTDEIDRLSSYGTCKPLITKIEPAVVPCDGHIFMTVWGEKFSNDVVVLLDGKKCRLGSLSCKTDERGEPECVVTVETPSLSMGFHTLVVSNPRGGRATLDNVCFASPAIFADEREQDKQRYSDLAAKLEKRIMNPQNQPHSSGSIVPSSSVAVSHLGGKELRFQARKNASAPLHTAPRHVWGKPKS